MNNINQPVAANNQVSPELPIVAAMKDLEDVCDRMNGLDNFVGSVLGTVLLDQIPESPSSKQGLDPETPCSPLTSQVREAINRLNSTMNSIHNLLSRVDLPPL